MSGSSQKKGKFGEKKALSYLEEKNTKLSKPIGGIKSAKLI